MALSLSLLVAAVSTAPGTNCNPLPAAKSSVVNRGEALTADLMLCFTKVDATLGLGMLWLCKFFVGVVLLTTIPAIHLGKKTLL